MSDNILLSIVLGELSHSEKIELLFKKRIWQISDVVLFTGLSKGTVYNLVSQGRLPKRKRAGRLYFDPDEIHDWILQGI